MKQLPFITESLFKQHSPVTSNTDITEFVPYIAIAQELHIEPLLGEALTSELKEQIEANSLTLDNSALVLRIAPALSFYAIYQALPFHWASIVNKGITIRESENSKGIDIKDLAQLRQWIKNDADTLKSKLTDFLYSNRDWFPLWCPDTDTVNSAAHKSCGHKDYDSGFFFKK